MKVYIDTDNKIIKVESQINFKKLMEFIQTLPDWEEYKLEANTEIVINPSPVVINPSPVIIKEIKEVRPWRPWYEHPTWPYEPTITCGTGDITSSTNGEFVFEISA